MVVNELGPPGTATYLVESSQQLIDAVRVWVGTLVPPVLAVLSNDVDNALVVRAGGEDGVNDAKRQAVWVAIRGDLLGFFAKDRLACLGKPLGFRSGGSCHSWTVTSRQRLHGHDADMCTNEVYLRCSNSSGNHVLNRRCKQARHPTIR